MSNEVSVDNSQRWLDDFTVGETFAGVPRPRPPAFFSAISVTARLRPTSNTSSALARLA